MPVFDCYSVVLNDKTLLRLAERIHADQPHLGVHLGLKYAEIQRIKSQFPDSLEAALNVLLVRCHQLCVEA